jgi:hypothetical protein
MKLQAGRLGQSATETTHANRSPVTRPVLVNYWRSLNCATTVRYIPKHITIGETEMTENEVKVKTLEQFLIEFHRFKENKTTMIVIEMALFKDIAQRILDLEKAAK